MMSSTTPTIVIIAPIPIIRARKASEKRYTIPRQPMRAQPPQPIWQQIRRGKTKIRYQEDTEQNSRSRHNYESNGETLCLVEDEAIPKHPDHQTQGNTYP